jgi:ferric-dicitrate binding protein FerR (iron transport regulator)
VEGAVRLEGEGLEKRVFTGTVRSDAIADWLSAVEQVFPVQVEDRGAGGIVLTERTTPFPGRR